MSYDDRIARLSNVLRQLSEEQDANAAVALLLKRINNDFEVLVVKRTVNPSDPWSGQMALPGGKRGYKDKDLIQTVVRETLEETNIDLLDNCFFLGTLEPFRSSPRPEVKILPFIVLAKHHPPIRLGAELDDFSWIPLEELARSKATVRFDFGEFPAYVVGSDVIWGLTYRILEKLISILENLS